MENTSTFYPIANLILSVTHYNLRLSFPVATRPLLVTLQKELPNPFIPATPAPEEDKNKEEKENGDEDSEENTDEKDGESKEKEDEKKQKPINIELDRIEERVVAFPYSHGRYGQIAGIEGKAIFTTYPVKHATNVSGEDEQRDKGKLHAYDFKEQKKEVLVSDIASFYTFKR